MPYLAEAGRAALSYVLVCHAGSHVGKGLWGKPPFIAFVASIARPPYVLCARRHDKAQLGEMHYVRRQCIAWQQMFVSFNVSAMDRS